MVWVHPLPVCCRSQRKKLRIERSLVPTNMQHGVPHAHLDGAVEDAMKLVHQGAANRKVGETNMNRASSRSHSVFTMKVECRSDLDNGLTHTQFGTLHMVDLAGSERVKISGAQGAALNEASEINLSLTTLGRVISKVWILPVSPTSLP